jgi:ABC-2 type transport system ATP-binding protein
VTAIETTDLGRRYGRRWALRGCELVVPAGRIVGLVGANGAGKTTLLHLAVGLQSPSEGSIRVLGDAPGSSAAQLGRVGFLAQDAPIYAHLSVAEHLHLGRVLNPGWDADLARRRIEGLGLDPAQRAGRLSGGQRSQLALTLAMGKRPELLVLDEPVASLDPLARRGFLQDLAELVVEHGPTVVLSSHLLSDVERICDHLIVLSQGRVCLEGPVDELLATHRVLTGPRREPPSTPADQEVVQVRSTSRQTTMLVRTRQPILDPHWIVTDVGLEELVLAYMARDTIAAPERALAVVRA